MSFLQTLGVALGILVGLLVLLFLRRLLISRGGVLEVSMRLYRGQSGRGWALGLARFAGDTLQWYRLFSLWPRPRCSLSRRNLTVLRRRRPSEQETIALMQGSVVLECSTDSGPVDLALTTTALTGFLSWLEAAAPGAGRPPYAAR